MEKVVKESSSIQFILDSMARLYHQNGEIESLKILKLKNDLIILDSYEKTIN